ncbi:MAG: arylesterase [Alteromonadales bacterium]|nr:arylesterase [Alteromonadales bacterium]
MLKLALFLPILLSLFACSQDPMLNKLDNSDTILAFGDSLTFGYGAQKHQSYPSVLSKLSGLKVINAGINGELSSEGLQRLEKLLDWYQPELLLLCHGANDMLQKRSLQTMAGNLEAMVKLAQLRDIQVLLIAVPNTNLLLTPLKEYQQVADKMSIPLESDLISDILSKPSLHSDIIHPNALGYQKMAEQIHQDLIELGAL